MERALRALGVRPVRPVGTAQRLARVVGGGLCVLALAGAPWAQGAVPKDTLPASFSRSVPLGLPMSLTERWGSDEEAQLGRRLFFDPVLSADRSVACASCHDPAFGFGDSRAHSLGVGGQATPRNSPTLINRVLGESFMWDGRMATLEEQVVEPIQNPTEMALPLADAIERLRSDAAYVTEFERAFGEPPGEAVLARALAGFVRRIVRGESRVDRFQQGDFDVLTPEERGGLWFFESRGGCWRCHSGPNFSDESFHNTGVGVVSGNPEPGRFAVTGSDEDRGAFKTPTLRGLAETAPYMHDGSLGTLREVVEFYRRGGEGNPHLDAFMGPLEMSDRDAENLVAFLEAL